MIEDNSEEFNIDRDRLDRINQSMILDSLITPDNIYLDLSMIRDFTVGAYLTVLLRKKDDILANAQYDLFVKNIDVYRKRKFNDMKHYVPDIVVSTDEINDCLVDESAADTILALSPITAFMDTFMAQIAVNVNHSAVKHKFNPITVTINTYPLQVNTHSKDIIGSYMADTLGVNIVIVYKDPASFTKANALAYDEFYLMYLDRYLSVEEIRTAYSEMLFIDKRLYTPRIINTKYNGYMDTNKEFIIVANTLNILTNFEYIDISFVSANAPSIEIKDKTDA